MTYLLYVQTHRVSFCSRFELCLHQIVISFKGVSKTDPKYTRAHNRLQRILNCC
jgi:hypothetical protein